MDKAAIIQRKVSILRTWNNRKKKMNRKILITVVLVALVACTAPQMQGTAKPAPTDIVATSDLMNDNPGGTSPGSSMPPGATEDVAGWRGVIKTAGAGAQFDDYFERQDLGQSISFGIDSTIPVVRSQIESLRDSGTIIHIFGTLVSNVPDYNGSQILVDRIEVEE